MPKLITHLNFNGDCQEAFRFYEKCLGGKVTYCLTFEESPMRDKIPPEWGKKVCHLTFKLGNQEMYGADAPPEYQTKPQGFTISVDVDSAAEADKVFQDLADGGKITMPIQETFWAKRFGMVTDKFGTPWMVNFGGKGMG